MIDVNFDKIQGLIPVVVQDSTSREVLMVGFMDREAYEKTLATRYVTFWSRSRQSLWTKGETSGNRLRVDKLYIDCDSDTLLVLARLEGDGVCCHTGERSCFFTQVN